MFSFRFRVPFWIFALGATAIALFFSWPTLAADNGDVIVVEGNCPDGQHVDLGGSCTCNDDRETLVGGECSPDPNRLFEDLGGLFVDFCGFFGVCDGGGGGGGGGGGTPPDPEPEQENDECEEQAQCQSEYDQCAASAFEDSERCGLDAALKRCGGDGGLVFPGDVKPRCRLIEKTGAIFCTFPDSLQNAPFVGNTGGLFDRCISAWEGSDELDGEIAECQTRAIAGMLECQTDVGLACLECFQPAAAAIVPASLAASDGPLDQDPELGLFLRAKVRTRGETAIDTEAFVRNATKSTCYWHLIDGVDVPEGTLYCKAGDAWDQVGASRFLMADGDQYLADGACGVATQDGVASGSATFHWKVERDDDGRLVSARMKSVAGHIVGSLDGAHPYYGDCKVTGKAIEERDVPSGLRELVR